MENVRRCHFDRAPSTMMLLRCYTRFKFRLILFALSLLWSMKNGGLCQSLQNIGGIPVRVTRTEGVSDRFAFARTNCGVVNSDWCTVINPVDNPKDTSSCACQCPEKFPIFQDDISTCVQQIPESGGKSRKK